MQEIRLTRIALHNFKGFKCFELEAGGENLSVYGDNGTGKTTIADAFSWLLFGKDSAGRSDFEIKTLDKDGTPIHFLDHSVTATIRVNGSDIELEKIYREKWVRQRGAVDREFQGHETEYHIDGIPKSKTEYTAFVKGIVDEELFRLLTNPMYFNNIDKKARRTMLFDAFGDISDADVIAANFSLLGDLTELTGTHTLDELKTATAQKKRRVSADLQAIPYRIDEASRLVNDTVKATTDELEAEREKHRGWLAEKEEALRSLNTDTMADEYRRKAREEIRELEAAAMEERDKAYEEVRAHMDAVNNAEQELKRVSRSMDEAATDISVLDSRIISAKKMLEQYRKEWQEVFDSKYESDNICPACGQHLPTEQIEAAVAKFNASKARNLDRINGEGERIKNDIAKYECKQENIKDLIKNNEAKRDCYENIKVERQRLADDARRKLDDLTKKRDEAIAEKKNDLAEWENSRTVDATVAEAREAIESDIAALRAKIRAFEEDYAILKNNETLAARITELENEARRLSAEYEKLERIEYLIGEFTKIKASMLEAKINSKFKYARFKLFETQINGGVVETCEVTYNGVPYSVLNNAAKINMGIDIINAFSEAYGVTGVIFLDNAESVTEVFRSSSQLVKLYVSAADDALRIEKDII